MDDTYQVIAGGGFADVASAEELARTHRSDAFVHRLEGVKAVLDIPARGARERDRT